MITLPEDATIADYQRYIFELEQHHGWLPLDLPRNCFQMGEEVGELFRAVRRLEKVPPGAPLREARVADVAEEVVDVFNYLLAISNRLEIDLEQTFRRKNAYNQQRSWE